MNPEFSLRVLLCAPSALDSPVIGDQVEKGSRQKVGESAHSSIFNNLINMNGNEAAKTPRLKVSLSFNFLCESSSLGDLVALL